MLNLKSINIWMALVFLILAIELVSAGASYFANLLNPAFSAIDPDRVFAWLTVHHIFQLALTVFVMKVIFRATLFEWGFNFNQWRMSLVIIAVFVVVFSVIEYWYMSGATYDPGFPLTPTNKLGWQGFQYLFSGLGEEPFFRGLVIVLLLNSLHSTKLAINHQHILVVIISTVLFMFAHLNVDWATLSVTGYDFGQQTKALQLGILYAIVFIHTRSLFAPIVLHGLSNGITATIGFYIV